MYGKNVVDCMYYIMKKAGTDKVIECKVTCGVVVEFKFINDIRFFICCSEEDSFLLAEIDGVTYDYGLFSSPIGIWEKMCAEHGCLRGCEENERR